MKQVGIEEPALRTASPGHLAPSCNHGPPVQPFGSWPGVGTGGPIRSSVDVRNAYAETAMAAALYAVTGDLHTVGYYYGGPAFPALLSRSPPAR